MRIYFIIKIFIVAFTFKLSAQTYPVPQSAGESHPRILARNTKIEDLNNLVEKKDWAKAILEKTKNRLKPILDHTQKEKDWLASRLQMYWETKSTQVYINGGTFDHADGSAPFPTIKFPGTRDHRTDYKRPKLEDVKPFLDDPRGLYLQHKNRPDTWEWAGISKTGKIIESINREILSIAKDAAFLYWFTQDEKYAHLAYGVLDVYLTGLYYRNEPIDISHGHHQTLVGYTSFEVIQEHIVEDVSLCYDFLHNYIKNKNPKKLKLYDASLQKWADLIIKNGVSFNNWNLLQAAHISKITLVLEDNNQYENGKGGPYYLDQIMNHTSTRQWSMKKLIDYGYDENTGVWNESPGYSMNVLNDFIHFAEFYDRNFNIDLIQYMPVLRQSVISAPEYLYPNKFQVAFGDGHYGHLRSEPIKYLIENAQKYNKPEDEVYFTKMFKTIYGEEGNSKEFQGNKLADLFFHEGLSIKEGIHPGKLSDFTSPLFYAPNTSWLVQRLGDDENDALMISQIGSLGNHMHSNGIAMELYGKGLPLAPEMGHGSSYFSIEYGEYYTQFPAHNTVIVNGKSKYPEMKSNHAFQVLSSYPKSQVKVGNIKDYTFSDLQFLEPETNSTQRRTMGIVKNEKGGFYIDIFRSKQNMGNDVKHEYFFHNLGQELNLFDTNNTLLDLKSTEKLAFGDGDLMAYDYMWDKKAIETNQDFKGLFVLKLDDRTVNMNLWFKGEPNREVFSVLSPKSTAFRHGPLPEKFNDNPIPTLVVKQNGEAWLRPFVAIYEPAENGDSNIASVDYFGERERIGIRIVEKQGKEHIVFSNTNGDEVFKKDDLSFQGTYGIYTSKNDDFTLFLGSGSSISNDSCTLKINNATGSASLNKKGDKWFVTSNTSCQLIVKVGRKLKSAKLIDASGKEFKGNFEKKTQSVIFNLPKTDYREIKIQLD